MLRGVARHCVASQSVIGRYCATLHARHRKELQTQEAIDDGSRRERARHANARRDGAVIHKVSYLPQTYEIERIIPALRACVEPAHESEHVKATFYCLTGAEKTKKDKFRSVSGTSVLPFPEFGKRAAVGLFTDGELVEEMEGQFDEVVLKDDFTSFFTEVHKGNKELCEIYVATTSVESLLKRYGAVLKDKTPSSKKGLVAATVEDMHGVLVGARFLRRIAVEVDGICTVDVGTLDVDVQNIKENVQHVGRYVKDLMDTAMKNQTKKSGDGDEETEKQMKYLEYCVVSQGPAAFCLDLASVNLTI